jgi:hypothetical protein
MSEKAKVPYAQDAYGISLTEGGVNPLPSLR